MIPEFAYAPSLRHDENGRPIQCWQLIHRTDNPLIYVAEELDTEPHTWTVIAKGPVPQDSGVEGELNIQRTGLDYVSALAIAEYIAEQLRSQSVN